MTFVNRRKSLYTGKTSKPVPEALQTVSDGHSTVPEGCSLRCSCRGPLPTSPWRFSPQIRGTRPHTKPRGPPGRRRSRNACSDVAGLPAPPGNSYAHDQEAACPPALSSVHRYDATNAPAIPHASCGRTRIDRLAACQTSPLRTHAPVPTQPPTRCRLPVPWMSPRHPPRLAPPHPLGSCRGIQSASRRPPRSPGLLATMWLRRGLASGLIPPIVQTSLLGTASRFSEPTLSPKCSQDWPRFPSFPPVSRSKRPQTSLLGTDANPCTRVKHQNRPPKWLWTVPDSLARPLDGIAPSAKAACSHVAALQLRRSTS